MNGNLSVNGTTPMLSQLGFSVGTEQVIYKYHNNNIKRYLVLSAHLFNTMLK